MVRALLLVLATPVAAAAGSFLTIAALDWWMNRRPRNL